MILPEGVSEQQVLDAIENAVRVLGPSFIFGIWDLDDIRQEARMEGWRVIGRYDRSRPLENFLYTCIRNRLIRLKRDRLRRNDPPCSLCHESQGNRSLHDDGQFCPRYVAWRKRNDAKANLMRPLDLERVADQREGSTHLESDVENRVEIKEILALIDERLEVDLRATYLQMRAGQSVPKARRQAVEAAVAVILRGASGDDEAED